MPFYDSETIEQVRQIDLLAYLQNYDPQELVHVSGDVYCTKTHDSLRISNGKWCWFSRGIGGKSALDYLIKVQGCTFLEAMELLTGEAARKPPVFVPAPKEKKPNVFLMPEASRSTSRTVSYLTGRGIAPSIIEHCMSTGRIYESLPHHNVVFLGLDETGKARFGCQRGTGRARFHGDLNGSDKRYAFSLPAEGNTGEVHLFESAIDLLSYATLYEISGKNWRQLNLLSLAGVYQPREVLEESKVPIALTHFLETHPSVKSIVLHLDNDEPGRLAAKAIMATVPKDYEVQNRPPPCGKDVNDYLCMWMQQRIRQSSAKPRETIRAR